MNSENGSVKEMTNRVKVIFITYCMTNVFFGLMTISVVVDLDTAHGSCWINKKNNTQYYYKNLT